MSLNLDLEYIDNMVMSAAKTYMETNKPKTRSEHEKANDQPVYDVGLVKIMIREAVKQLIERQDSNRIEDTRVKDEEITELKGTVSKLQKENCELRNIIDDTEQYNRRDNLKIVGVPYKKNENIVQIVKDIAKHTTGEELRDDEISVAHRVMSKKDRERLDKLPASVSVAQTAKDAPSIVAKFTRRTTKIKIFESRKQTTVKPSPPYPHVAIYDDVTPLRSRILYALRNKKNNDGNKVYKFVWSREGRIYCRTESESQQETQPPPHIVNCSQDLRKLGWKDSEIEDIIHKKNFSSA